MNTYKQILALQSKVEEQVNNNKFTVATKTQLKSLQLAQSLNSPKLTAILYQRLGQILEQKGGNIQKSLYAYESAFKALNEEDHQLEKTIGRLRKVSKSYRKEKAIEIPDVFSPEIERSLEKALEEEGLAVKLLINIGNGYFYQPQLGPALNAFQEVLKQEEIANQPVLKAQTLVKIGEIFRQQKKIDQVYEKVKAAFDLLEQHGSEKDKRHAYALQARLHFQKQEIDQALPVYQKAITLFEEVEDYKNVGKIYAQLGQLYLGQGNFKKAKEVYLKTLDYSENNPAVKLEWHVYWGLGSCCMQEEDWGKAVDYFEKSRKYILKRQDELYTDEGKVAFLESTQDVFQQLIKAYLKIGDENAIEKALQVAEDAKGQSLNDLMEGRRRYRAKTGLGNKATPDADFNPIQQMSSGTSAPPVDLNLPSEGMDMMRQEAPGINLHSFANNPPDLLSGFVQESKDATPTLEKRDIPNRCFLFFYKLEKELLIWLKKPDGRVIFHKLDLDGEQLFEKVNMLRVSLLNDAKSRGIDISRSATSSEEEENLRGVATRKLKANGKDFNALSKELFAKLVQPFQSDLADDNTIVIVPHDFLWLIPFAALQNKKGEYLSEQFRLLYTPSMKALVQIDDSRPYSEVQNAKALVIGNPRMSEAHETYRFQPLKGAEKEAVTVGKLFKAEPLLHKAASRKAVEEVAASNHVIHLATHGIVDEKNPLDSFVVLADSFREDGSLEKEGLLKARDIMAWSLPCELVNLSACQTALGQLSGEGVIGLSRSFLVAGSRTVLVSLWNISDEATAAFMIAFYKKYIAIGNKAQALQSAIQELRARPEYQHPVFWSAFTLVGSDN